MDAGDSDAYDISASSGSGSSSTVEVSTCTNGLMETGSKKRKKPDSKVIV